MKKIIVTLLIFSALILSACSRWQSSGIGIIGGADGPTAVLVSESKSEKDEIKMVNIGGELYIETDLDAPLFDVDKAFDGKLKRNGTVFEIPKSDGEANFRGAKGYKLSDDDTAYVYDEDEWEVFKRLDSNRDLLKYKYCYTVEGRMTNAVKDSEYLVLANEKDIKFSDAVYQMIGSSSEQMKDIYVLPIVD